MLNPVLNEKLKMFDPPVNPFLSIDCDVLTSTLLAASAA